MPFIIKTKISQDTSMGVWQITEPEDLLRSAIHLSGEDEEFLGDIRNTLRRKQWLACRVVVADLTGDRKVNIRYTPKGEPVLAESSYHISLSHAGEFAAAIVSTACRAGIDIEQLRDRVLRVAERFMTPDELGRAAEPHRLEKICVHWSAKEALYKLYGGDQPDLQHGIVLEPFDYLCSGSGVVTATVFHGNECRTHQLHYLETGRWILVYTLEPVDKL